MSKLLGGWIHSFTVTDTAVHKNGYTIYKITSVIFPKAVPEALTCVTVWKRFSEVKRLYRELLKRHKSLQLRGILPPTKDRRFFKRFDPEVIQERKEYILELLDFAAQHPALYKSHSFLNFLENGHTPGTSPLHQQSNIEAICSNLDLEFENHVELVDPHKDIDQSLIDSFVSDNNDVVKEGSIDEIDHIKHSDSVQDEKTTSNIFTPTIFQIQNEDNDYIYEAAYEFSRAVQAEVNQSYFEAYEKYKSGIDKLLTGSKGDSNEERKAIAKIKVAKYMARLEEINEKCLESETQNKNGSKQLEVQSSSCSDEKHLERPWNQLSKFKVIKVIESVMQVQDVTEKRIYIMKAIEKPSTNSSAQAIFLPQNIPYMVKLIGFYQSDTTIYLLLQAANGGKLFDYVHTYQPPLTERVSMDEIFTEPTDSINIHESISKTISENTVTNSTNNNNDGHSEIEIAQPAVEIFENSVPFEETIQSTVKNSEISTDIQEMDTKDLSENYIPSFDILSEEMDVTNIVSCSEKLLQSVSHTLQQFKQIESEAENNEAITLGSCLNVTKKDVSDTEADSKKLALIPGQSFISSNKIYRIIIKPIPEPSIKQWARELLTAIENLHWKEIILGDLRPANILLGSKGQLLLSYFYKSESSDSSTQIAIHPDSLEGFYVAPERPLIPKSDWWSYGVILFELLTGYTFQSCHPAGLSSYYEIQYPDVELTVLAQDLLDGLLQFNPELRLGADKIKIHPFFDGSDWTGIARDGINSI